MNVRGGPGFTAMEPPEPPLPAEAPPLPPVPAPPLETVPAEAPLLPEEPALPPARPPLPEEPAEPPALPALPPVEPTTLPPAPASEFPPDPVVGGKPPSPSAMPVAGGGSSFREHPPGPSSISPAVKLIERASSPLPRRTRAMAERLAQFFCRYTVIKAAWGKLGSSSARTTVSGLGFPRLTPTRRTPPSLGRSTRVFSAMKTPR